jgi:hypothetical protein
LPMTWHLTMLDLSKISVLGDTEGVLGVTDLVRCALKELLHRRRCLLRRTKLRKEGEFIDFYTNLLFAHENRHRARG